MGLPEHLLPQYQQAGTQMHGPRLGIKIDDAGAQGLRRSPRSSRSRRRRKPASRTGDVVVSVNGIKPKHEFDLLSILGTIPEKGAAKLSLLRDGKAFTKSITLK